MRKTREQIEYQLSIKRNRLELYLKREAVKVTVKRKSIYCHFNRHPDAGYDLNFFNGLLSEKLVLTHTRRGDRWAWEKLPGHNRNEALDCRDYANAGLKIINPDMDAIERRLQGLEEKPKAPQQRRQRPRHNRADAFDDW